ncbi:MAG: heme biosynthesis protein HemY [Alphaproteobacteria bacterium]
MLVLFAGLVVVAVLVAWLADQPGNILIEVAGYRISMSVMVGAALLALFAGLVTLTWRSYHWLTGAPGMIGGYFRTRGKQRGYEALSRGMIAAGAGDGQTAGREAAIAERALGGQPMTLLLKAQTAQLKGDEATARRVFEAMLQLPETEILGLRGLFVLARKGGAKDQARQLAERAAKLSPAMSWSSLALFELQSAELDWAGASATLALRRQHKLINKTTHDRQAAVLATADALALESTDTTAALAKALAAHKQAPDLVPAAVLAGRLLAERGDMMRAARLLEKTWKLAPHPEIAFTYSHARPGDSARDRLTRVKSLAAKRSDSSEAAIAIAYAAIEAKEWEVARNAVKSEISDRPSRRFCMAMAEIENGETGDQGRVRQWLARAVNAPRDPAWTADGYVSQHWAPVSPVTGALDAFAWKVPIEGVEIPTPTLDFSSDTAPSALVQPVAKPSGGLHDLSIDVSGKPEEGRPPPAEQETDDPVEIVVSPQLAPVTEAAEPSDEVTQRSQPDDPGVAEKPT